MDRLIEKLKLLQEKPTLQLVMGLGFAVLALVLVGVVGLFAVGDDGDNLAADRTTQSDDSGLLDALPEENQGLAEETTTTVAGATATTVRKPGQPPAQTVGGGGITKNDLVSEQGATRV